LSTSPVNAKFVTQLVKYSLINSWSWVHNYYERRHPACERDKSLTVEDQLLIKTAQTEKDGLLKKWLLSFQRESGNGICCLISYK